jgi:hypothetical protein
MQYVVQYTQFTNDESVPSGELHCESTPLDTEEAVRKYIDSVEDDGGVIEFVEHIAARGEDPTEDWS